MSQLPVEIPSRGVACSLVFSWVCTVGDATVCDAVLACLSKPVAAFGPDGITSSFVFVVGVTYCRPVCSLMPL